MRAISTRRCRPGVFTGPPQHRPDARKQFAVENGYHVRDAASSRRRDVFPRRAR